MRGTRDRATAMTPVAVFFTLVSLAWTGYSITDLMASGPWGLLAAASVDGLWGVVQFLDYKGIGGKPVRACGWAALVCASGLLAYHGTTINPAAAIAGALPPIVAKAAWLGDIRLRRDPTALTPGQEAEINDVIRDSEYLARMKAAQIRRDAAEEIALIRAQADVTLARDEADFAVGLERLRKRAELERRRPLGLTPAEPAAHPAAEPGAVAPEPLGSTGPVAVTSSLATTSEPPAQPPAVEGRTFGFTAPTVAQSAQRAQSVARVVELLAQDPGLTSGQVAEALAVSPATAKRYLREARQGGRS
ncbi:winged helix-turn-helix transcriptional regulator [Streptomyces sp. NPDC004031]